MVAKIKVKPASYYDSFDQFDQEPAATTPFRFPANGEVLTTQVARLLGTRALENHHHDNKVVIWTQTQTAFTEVQTSTIAHHDYGHGFFVLLATPLIAKIREPEFHPRNPVQVVQDLIQDLKAEELSVRLQPDEDGAQERELLIEDQFAIDLPSGSTRAIITRLENIDRHSSLSHTKRYRRACLRVLKAIRCGVEIQRFKPNPTTNEMVPVFHDVIVCKQQCCTRPICHSHLHKAKERLVTRTMDAMVKNAVPGHYDSSATKVMFVIKHHHPLPKEELKDPRHPTFDLRGRGRPTFLRPSKPIDQELERPRHGSLLKTNLNRHTQARTKLINNPKAKRLFGDASAYLTETSWLVPATPGLRCFPYPHTHILTSIHGDPEDARYQLQTLLRKYTPAAEVLVSVLQPKCSRSLHAQAQAEGSPFAALSAYFGKTHTITPDDKNPEFYEAKLSSADVVNVLDDRSLAEVIDLYDFGKTPRFAAAFNVMNKNRKNTNNRLPFIGAGEEPRSNPNPNHKRRVNSPYALRAWKMKQKLLARDGGLEREGARLDALKLLPKAPCSKARSLRLKALLPDAQVPVLDSQTQVLDSQTQVLDSQTQVQVLDSQTQVQVLVVKPSGEEKTKQDVDLRIMERLGVEVELLGVRCQSDDLGTSASASVRSLDHGSRTETRHVGHVSFVAKPWMVPTGRLLNQQAGDGRLAKGNDGNNDRELAGSDRQTHPSQDADPGLGMEKYDNDLIATNKYVALVEEHLVHDLLRACEQGDRAGELKGLRVLIKSDDDLDSIDFIQVLGVDTESSLPGSLVARAQGRVGSGRDYGSETVRCEAE